MSERITITVAAGGDDAEARVFGAALGDILDILDSLVKEAGENVVWRIVDLAKNSPPTITLESRKNIGAPGRLVVGLRELQRGVANPFPIRAMRAARRLGWRLHRRQLDSITVSTDEVGAVSPTEKIEQNADRAITARHYVAPGSVDGKLDIVNVRSGVKKFTVLDETTLADVRCYFSDQIFDEVKQTIGKRVTAVGEVKYDATTDRPISIRVESIELLEDDSNPPKLFSQMKAIDIAGKLSSEEYIRRMRDGGG